MKTYEATEQAYKNGYERGYKDGKSAAVKRGRWRWRKYGGSHFYCSECEIGVPFSYTAHKYCPNCGVRMDGDGDG